SLLRQHGDPGLRGLPGARLPPLRRALRGAGAPRAVRGTVCRLLPPRSPLVPARTPERLRGLTRLRCPRRGFARVRCDGCNFERLAPFSVGRVPSRTGAAASTIRTPALLSLRLSLLPGPLRRGRRSSLLCPRITVAKRGHVRVPAGHRAEHQGRARTVAGRHVAGPVRAGERQLLLAGGAPFPERRVSVHRDALSRVHERRVGATSASWYPGRACDRNCAPASCAPCA